MNQPSRFDERDEREADGPYPDVRGAFVLTLLAMFAAAFTGVAFMDFGLLAAVGVGQAIGVGAVATMGAKRVGEPQAERLGLRILDWKSVPAILCLAPAVLIVSELDNFAADWSASGAALEQSVEDPADALDPTGFDEESEAADPDGPGSAEGARASEFDSSDATADNDIKEELAPLIDPNDPWTLLQAFVVMVGISPVVEEFLFRGVIQQGLVRRLGMLRGVATVALLWTMLRPAPLAGVTRFVVATLASFGLGWALGIVRIATGSILGPILLASSWAAIGLGSLALEGRLDLPGMNVEGTHLPWSVTFASLVLVAWAGQAIQAEATQRDAAERLARQTAASKRPANSGSRSASEG
jgi:membrane protease YdiL (CAAX protease family)